MPVGQGSRVSGMRLRSPRLGSLLAAVLATVLLLGCTDSPADYENLPQPESPLGFFAVEMARTAPPRFSSLSFAWHERLDAEVIRGPLADQGISLEASGASSVFTLGDQVYVSAEFVLTNQSDEVLDGLVLLAYHREEFRVGSAVSQPVYTNGRVAPDRVVRQIRPTQTFAYDEAALGPDGGLVGLAGKSDFVAVLESDLPSLAEFDFVSTLFPYGFAVRSASDPTSRSIAPGGQGRVHVAFSLPAGTHAGSISSFTWNAVLVRTDRVNVTQAREENHPAGWAGVLDRATTEAADVVVAVGGGIRATPQEFCDSVLGIRDVRLAGVDASDPNHMTLVEQPGEPEFAGCEGAP